MSIPSIPSTLVYLGDAIELDADTYSWMWKRGSGWVVSSDSDGKTLYLFHAPKHARSNNPVCGTGMRIQTYLFDRDYYDPSTARDWLTAHKAKTPRAEVTTDYIRYRQEPPSHFEKSGFRTKRITTGISAVMGCPLKRWSKNPSPTAKARDLYKRFNRRNPRDTRVALVPNASTRVGRVAHIAYRSTKFGPCQSYMHVFKNKPVVWTDNPDDPGVFVLRGTKIRVTQRGIEG